MIFHHSLTLMTPRAPSYYRLGLRLKGPAKNIRRQHWRLLDLFRSRFELFHVPIAPDEFSAQEMGFRARDPEDEMRR